MEAASTHNQFDDRRPHLDVGARVLVRNSLNLWSTGFQVSSWREDTYEVRRCSDGAVLPRAFASDDIRPA